MNVVERVAHAVEMRPKRVIKHVLGLGAHFGGVRLVPPVLLLQIGLSHMEGVPQHGCGVGGKMLLNLIVT